MPLPCDKAPARQLELVGSPADMGAMSKSDGSTEPYQAPLLAVLLEAIERIRPLTIVLASVAAVSVVGIGDYITGPDISFSAFYLLPVVLAATTGRRIGLCLAVLTAFMWFAADLSGRPEPYDTLLTPIWNACIRFLVFALVVALLDALRAGIHHERNISREDSLSGLPNSRAFYERAEAERRRLARSGEPLTLAYLDIDNFKGINDTLGHSAGDAVLRATAQTLRRAIRAVDIAGRLGGDEFAVLFPNTTEAGATLVLSKIQEELRHEAATHDWPISFSIGSVTYKVAPPSVDVMISRADRLMYEVKRAGKNGVRVIVAP